MTGANKTLTESSDATSGASSLAIRLEDATLVESSGGKMWKEGVITVGAALVLSLASVVLFVGLSNWEPVDLDEGWVTLGTVAGVLFSVIGAFWVMVRGKRAEQNFGDASLELDSDTMAAGETLGFTFYLDIRPELFGHPVEIRDVEYLVYSREGHSGGFRHKEAAYADEQLQDEVFRHRTTIERRGVLVVPAPLSDTWHSDAADGRNNWEMQVRVKTPGLFHWQEYAEFDVEPSTDTEQRSA